MKSITYRFYYSDGSYAATLTEDDFIGYPNFGLPIGDGPTELRMEGAHTLVEWYYPSTGMFTYTGEDIPPGFTGRTIEADHGIDKLYNAITLANIVKIFVHEDDGTETQIYSGILSGFDVTMEGGKERIILTIIPSAAQLAARILREGADTSVPYNSLDPADIVKDILDKAETAVTYDETSIHDVGVPRTYQFNAEFSSSAIKKIVSLCPQRWIHFIGGDDKLYLRNIDLHGTLHTIPLTNVNNVTFTKSLSALRNRVLFLGGGSPQLYKQYERTGSQNAWGLWEDKIADERVTLEDTAKHMADRFLNERQTCITTIQVEIPDVSFNPKGYRIESIKPGDRIKLTSDQFDFAQISWGNFYWGTDPWKYSVYALTGLPAVVTNIQYRFDSCVCECAFEFQSSSERIEDINRDLTDFRFANAPSTPA